MGFVNDLRKGKDGESLALELLKKEGYNCVSSKDKEYDLYLCLPPPDDKRCFSIEVKYDIYAEKSGNVAIEYHNPKKKEPSGISSSQADIWCYVFSESDIWFVKTHFLRAFCQNNQPCRTIKRAGDGNASIYLYAKHRILGEIFKSSIKEALEVNEGCC